jgi:aspartyl-tRNA(Asn)/glutamyl-tRNA(Gln) amidotransferase subunit A
MIQDQPAGSGGGAIEAVIETLHGIAAPNVAARRLAALLPDSIAAHHRLRPPPGLDQNPADFARTLASLAEPVQTGNAADRSDALSRLGLSGLRGRLRRAEETSAAALEAQLALIDASNGRLNAVLWQAREQAREQAASADAAYADARRRGWRLAWAETDGPPALLGVPLAHKDIFGIGGMPQTAGSAYWRHHVARATATVIDRLHRAGSITFAGLHMADFAQNPTGQNAAYGDAINPWNAARITGGSSSGSGVAIAAGYTTAALGTDTGGSIRLPAACCGVTGLKPTFGLVSRAGVVPLCASLDCVGPLARTALDCAIILDLIAGPDPEDPTAAARRPDQYEAALTGDIAGLRVGVPRTGPLLPADTEAAAAFDAAAAMLRACGAVIVPVDIPFLDEIVTYGGTVARAEAAALHARWMTEAPDRFVPHVAARLFPGYAVPATFYIEAIQQRPPLLRAFCQSVFAPVDVLALPTLPGCAPTRAETDMDSFRPGTEAAFFAVGDNVRSFNYLGLPALSLPIGRDSGNTPLGLQLVGRPFAEATLLRVADSIQREAGAPPLPAAAGPHP